MMYAVTTVVYLFQAARFKDEEINHEGHEGHKVLRKIDLCALCALVVKKFFLYSVIEKSET
jgi:hypothetical protein